MNLNPWRGMYNLGRKVSDDAIPGLFKKMGMPDKFAEGAGTLFGSFAGTIGAMLGGIAILSAIVVLPHFIAANIALAPMTALAGTLAVGGTFLGGGSLAAAASFGVGNKFFKWIKDKIPGGPKTPNASPDADADAEYGATISPVRTNAPDPEFGASVSPARNIAPEPVATGAGITPAALVPEFQTAVERTAPKPEAPAATPEYRPFQNLKQ